MVPNEECAIIVQDLATKWLQAFYPRKTKTSQETMKSWQKFLEPKASPNVKNHWNLAKPVKTSKGIIVRQHPHARDAENEEPTS